MFKYLTYKLNAAVVGLAHLLEWNQSNSEYDDRKTKRIRV